MQRSLFAATFVTLLLASRSGHARGGQTDVCVAAAERAQVQQHAGSLHSARESLLACSREACPGPIKTDCLRWLAEVQAAMPTFVVRVVDASGADVVEVRLLVDGARITDRLDGRPIEIDPGEHVLRVEAGASTIDSHLLVRQGERDRLVTVQLPAAPPVQRRPEPPPFSPSPPPGRRVPTGAWILGGAGLVAMSAGVFFWVRGRGDRSDLYASCGLTQSCSQDTIDSARTKVLVGDVAFGVGLAAVGVAVGWTLLTPAEPAPPTLGIAPLPGGGVVSWRSAF
jgi:hypothetical protein